MISARAPCKRRARIAHKRVIKPSEIKIKPLRIHSIYKPPVNVRKPLSSRIVTSQKTKTVTRIRAPETCRTGYSSNYRYYRVKNDGTGNRYKKNTETFHLPQIKEIKPPVTHRKLYPTRFNKVLQDLKKLEVEKEKLPTHQLIKGANGNYYSLTDTIGEGTFGKVFKTSSCLSDQPCFAVKVLERNKIRSVGDVTRVSREITILRHVAHPNVIRFTELLEDDGAIYIVLELMEEELFSYIVKRGSLDDNESRFFLNQILEGVEYLHFQGIIHRDLKPENLLLSGKHLRISDFGLSALISDAKAIKVGEEQYLMTACGSPCYAAPELVAGVPYDGRRTDIWAIGVILFAMLCGYLPFEDPDTQQLYKIILAVDYEIPSHLSDSAINLVENILVFAPRQRLYFPLLKEHPFLRC